MKETKQLTKESIDRFKYDVTEPEVDFPIIYLDPEKAEKDRQKILKMVRNQKQPKI